MKKGLIIALAAVLVLGLSGVAMAWDVDVHADIDGAWSSTTAGGQGASGTWSNYVVEATVGLGTIPPPNVVYPVPMYAVPSIITNPVPTTGHYVITSLPGNPEPDECQAYLAVETWGSIDLGGPFDSWALQGPQFVTLTETVQDAYAIDGGNHELYTYVAQSRAAIDGIGILEAREGVNKTKWSSSGSGFNWQQLGVQGYGDFMAEMSTSLTTGYASTTVSHLMGGYGENVYFQTYRHGERYDRGETWMDRGDGSIGGDIIIKQWY